MDTAERIYREAQTLPEAQAKEVLHFLEFLKLKLKKPTTSETKDTPDEDTLPGFGMWSDREDMSDSTTYVREIRSPRYKL
jgi:hypothetical protein